MTDRIGGMLQAFDDVLFIRLDVNLLLIEDSLDYLCRPEPHVSPGAARIEQVSIWVVDESCNEIQVLNCVGPILDRKHRIECLIFPEGGHG